KPALVPGEAAPGCGTRHSTGRPSGRPQPFESRLEIRDQVLDVLQASVDPEARPLVRPLRCRARLAWIEGHDQALEPAPGRADSVEFQTVDHRAERALGDALLEHHAEQTAGAGKISLPDRVSRVSGERRVQYAFDLGLASDPLGERDTRLPVLFQAHRERAQAPLTEINVVRTRRLAELTRRAPQPRPGSLRAG